MKTIRIKTDGGNAVIRFLLGRRTLLALLALVAALLHTSPALLNSSGLLSVGEAHAGEQDDLRFLTKHWSKPIGPQGAPPAEFTPLEASLLPKDCGVCHPIQYRDWQTTLHGKAMSPGVVGQIVDMLPGDPATVGVCLSCHAPLHEQHALKPVGAGASYKPNAAFNPELRQHGVACPVCHARSRRIFGPPRGPGVAAPPQGARPVPRPVHGGVQRTPAFEHSAFCKSCHQFDEDGYALNGKLLENTYNEWAASPYAKEGKHCQHCHMPDRRHLWRGIHDREMVRQAISVRVAPSQAAYQPGEMVQAVITVRNVGAGHFFPTYVTPKVFVRAQLVSADGKPLPNSQQVATIGREITQDLSREVYDTRIPPRQEVTFTYAAKLPAKGVTLQVRVVVEPDHFYERFFNSLLSDGSPKRGLAMIQQALAATKSSHFTVYSRDIPVS